MNPGYAGRQELPENLKIQFRGMMMMVPDRKDIMRTKLSNAGYNNSLFLAEKFNVVYALCEQQLSAQRHYDFGLRNINSVLRAAGNLLRDSMTEDIRTNEDKRKELETYILWKALMDMNLSKLVADDVDLFLGLLRDVFGERSSKKGGHKDLVKELEKVIKENKLFIIQSDKDTWFKKIIQLYETSLVRHGFMHDFPDPVGPTSINPCLTKDVSYN
jgi:dynein heavy chain